MTGRWGTSLLVIFVASAVGGCGASSDKGAGDTAGPPSEVRGTGDHHSPDLARADATPETTYPDGLPSGEVTTPIPDQPWQTKPERRPFNIHVTWTGDPSLTASIQWNIDQKESKGYTPQLWIVPTSQAREGREEFTKVLPFHSSYVVPGACEEYQEELLGVPMSETRYANCLVRVTGLEPGTEYSYRVGTWESYDTSTRLFFKADLSAVQRFRTAPLPGSREKFSFIAAGDSRDGSEAITANIGPMAARNADFWLFNGDMTEMGMQSEWDKWFSAMGPALSNSPIMVAAGNHEIVITTYWAQFDLPVVAEIPEILKERAWSFDYANVHFLAIDTNTTDNIISERDWVEADLTKADADPNIDFTIVMFHHAVYSSSNHGTVERVKEELVPIFERHKVPLVFNGHDHMYERTFPVRADLVNEENGIIYVVAGAFFAPPYSAGSNWWTAVSAPGDRGNYLVVEIDGTTIKGTGYYGDNTGTIDEFVIQR